jgi:N-acetylmuramoyl-L-alanine amidase
VAAAASAALVIIVDTGHTRAHPGAISPSGRVEFDYNLQVTDALSVELKKAQDRVVRVAADGNEIALGDRATHTPNADLFISIHHDSIQQAWIDAGRRREFRGFSVFVSKKNPGYEKSVDCAKAIGRQMIAIGESPSLYHATPIAGENRPLIDRALGVHRFDDLVVLKTAPVPAVLVEVGVIANPDEEIRLADPATVKRQAGAIARGIAACLQLD